MFSIGEFSRIAQVSGRLLRYYDQLGLFKPAQTDPETGYRFYSATQLPDPFQASSSMYSSATWGGGAWADGLGHVSAVRSQ